MLIVTNQGIYTAELCENSKKYLSRLLVGKTGINSDFLTWELLLKTEFNLNAFITDYHQAQGITQQAIIDKLVAIENQHTEEYLKPYDPEIKKQQAELHSKIVAWISVTTILVLTMAFMVPFALGLLGSSATIVGVPYLAVVAGLSCCSILPAFFGERLIDPKWMKEFSIKKEKRHQKLVAIKGTYKTADIDGEITEQHYQTTIAFLQQPVISSMAIANTTKNKILGNCCFFKLEKAEEASEIIHLKSFNTFANKSC